jgi:hypothetical protein
MSYTFNNSVSFEGTPQVDAFSRFRTSQLNSILEIKHVYDKNPLLIDEIKNGSATSTWTPNNSDVEMDTFTTGDYVIRSTKARGVYSPGKGGLFEATFMNFQIENNIIKRVGYFSSANTAPYNGTFDGFFLESNGDTNTITFQVWRSGTQIFSVDLSQWSSETFDPLNIDWELDQLFWCDFQWLGVGRIRFGLVIPEKGFVQFGEVCSANTIEDPYMTNPNQPIRYEIRQSGPGSGEFHQLCSHYAVEGSQNALIKAVSIQNSTERTLLTPGVKYPLLGYRCAQDWRGANIILDSLFALNQVTGTDYLITVEMNPGITGGTPIYTQIPNTPVEFSLGNGTLTVNTSGNIIKSYIGKGNAATTDNFQLLDNLIKPGVCIDGTRDIMWICVTPLVISGSTKIRAVVANLNYYD